MARALSLSDEFIRKTRDGLTSPSIIRLAKENGDFGECFEGRKAFDSELTAILRSIPVGIATNEGDKVRLSSRS